MKCSLASLFQAKVSRLSALPRAFPVSSPGRSVTRARRLYVSRLANFRLSDPRHGAEHRTCEAAN